MFKQVEISYDNTVATPTGNIWNPIVVSGYDTIVVTLEAPTGWTGTVSFWGGAGTTQYSPALWSLNDSDDASSVSQVTTYVGATPSYFSKNFKGSVAGLSEFGIYFAHPTTNAPAVGEFIVSVGLYSSAK